MESDKGRIGASFEAFLDEQGLREDVEGQAVKALVAERISTASPAKSLLGILGEWEPIEDSFPTVDDDGPGAVDL